MTLYPVLVVDDEPLKREILDTILREAGFEVFCAASGEEALELARRYDPAVILTDLKMEGMDGIELLEALLGQRGDRSIVIMTAHGTIASAVEAVRKGAFDYLSKPLEREPLLLTLRRAAERTALLRENRQLQEALAGRFGIEGIIGMSPKMRDVVKVLRRVSAAPSTVLILGESGTGKELVARALHFNSSRRTRPFVTVNSAAVPESLVESELFGYEPGAFTGARSRRKGLVEQADGGTLFLDEIGDLSPAAQAKLLRVMQEREVRRLGGTQALRVDVRLIAATNRDLARAVREGRFREDFYYRLRVVTIELPALRERREDIPALADFFIARFNRQFGRRIRGVTAAAMAALREYAWPGNIRQLGSVLERGVLLAEGETIDLADIRSELVSSRPLSPASFRLPEEGIDVEDLERELLRQAMERAKGVAARAARLLGMSYKTFLYRYGKSGLEEEPATAPPEGQAD